MQPMLESDRDKRTWAWICDQVGEAAALGALDWMACKATADRTRRTPQNHSVWWCRLK